MAVSEGSPVKFLQICGNSFYFEDECKTEVDGDAFDKCDSVGESYWLRSVDNKFLFVTGNEFQAKNLNVCQQSQLSECKFKIQCYKEDPKIENTGAERGKAVILYVRENGTNKVVYCNEQFNVCAKEMVLPERIEDTTDAAVFYMIPLKSSHMFRFQSSVDKSKYLGFDTDGHPSLKKLVLCPCSKLSDTCDIMRQKV